PSPYLPPSSTPVPYTTLFRSHGDVRGRRQQPRAPLHGVDPRQGHNKQDRGRPARAVPPRPAGRPPVRGQRAQPAAVAVLQSSPLDRKSTRLNSSHGSISYAVF